MTVSAAQTPISSLDMVAQRRFLSGRPWKLQDNDYIPFSLDKFFLSSKLDGEYIRREEYLMKNRKWVWLLFVIAGLMYSGICKDLLGAERAFPSKSIQLLVGFGPGGSTSMSGRIMAGTLSELLGTPVILSHKTGAGGALAPTQVAKSKADGYTLLVANTGPIAIAPAIRRLDYKIEDFEFLGQYAVEPMGLVVRSEAPWKTVEELVAYAKKNPGTLKFAMDGVNTPSNFGMELFKSAAGGLKIDGVPFTSGAEMVTAVLGGHAQMAYSYMMSAKGPYEGGRVRILAVGTERRLEEYPDIPTFVEVGYPEVKWGPWYGIAAPAGIPKEVSNKLKDSVAKAAQNSEVQKLLSKIGIIPVYKEPGEFTKFIKEEHQKVLKLVKDLGIKEE